MASIRKIQSGKWLAEVRLKSLAKPKSKAFATKLEAQSWAVETERTAGKRGIYSDYTLRDAMAKYSAEVSPTKKGARWEQVRLKKLLRHPIADLKLCELTCDDFQRWIADQTIAAGSINRELALLRSVLETSRKKWKWHNGQPMLDVDRPTNPPPRDRRIPEAEVAQVLIALQWYDAKPIRAVRDEVAVGFLLALETAMRQGEIWGLEWQRVHLEARYVALLETKNGSKRNVALSRRAVTLLEKLEPKPQGRVFRFSQQTASTVFLRETKAMGIKDLHFHDTRHEAITRLAQKIPVTDLARMVGHKDLKSLMIYYNATASEIAARLD